MMDHKQFENTITSGLEARWPGGQAVVVLAKDADLPEAEMLLMERAGSHWRIAMGPWPAVVGRGGVGKRAEGDGRSPSGAFLLGPAFGRAAPPEGMRYPYRRLDGLDRWVDDASSPFYNRWVRGSAEACGAGEELAAVAQYEHAVAVRYNTDAVRGLGSAIFLHVWNSPSQGTLGCTAIAPEHMRAVLKWLDYSRRPVLAQGTQAELMRLMARDWGMLCLPPGWGLVDDFLPDAQLDIRYHTANNFTGRRAPGYHAPAAPMRMEAIEALAGCARELREQNIGLRVFDAYRPQAATDAMLAWAEDERDTKTKAEYYPGIDKAEIPGNYVARRSGHRLGGTVDLTLLRWADGRDLDMGGPFDFFGSLSHVGYGGLTPPQTANRAALCDAMARSGFRPLESEWWHFSFPVEGEGGDFEILPLERVLREP